MDNCKLNKYTSITKLFSMTYNFNDRNSTRLNLLQYMQSCMTMNDLQEHVTLTQQLQWNLIMKRSNITKPSNNKVILCTHLKFILRTHLKFNLQV